MVPGRYAKLPNYQQSSEGIKRFCGTHSPRCGPLTRESSPKDGEYRVASDELKARALTRVALMTAAGIAILAGLVAVSLSTRTFEYFTASVNFVGLIVYSLLLYLQHRGWSLGARLIFLLAANLHLGLLLIFYGWNAGVYMYFFLMIAVPFAIFSRQQKALITPMAWLAVAMLMGVYIWYGVFEMQPLVVRDASGIMINRLTNLTGVSVGSILLMRHMRNVHFQAGSLYICTFDPVRSVLAKTKQSQPAPWPLCSGVFCTWFSIFSFS